MGRLVRKPRVSGVDQQVETFDGLLQPAPATAQVPGTIISDNYLVRMVKYIPAEIIGCSMVVNSILEQAVTSGGKNAQMAGFSVTGIAAGAFVVALILTPLFCWYVREEGDAWVINAVVSTVAFPFWAYLMGAVAFAGFHDGNLAVILILTVSVVSGLVAPVPSRSAAREHKSSMPMDWPRLVKGVRS